MKSSNIGGRINLFDSTEETVYDFNLLFPECPLPERFGNSEEVEIGVLLPNNCRVITVGEEAIKHKMFSDLLYGIDRDLFREDETDKELEAINGVEV